ncbi:hypothetical protein J6W91_02620 [Candidatus Saccharibacteria bacterium]|nr:hypothetical protein [Candidatus Saccharibacteria bacterium]
MVAQWNIISNSRDFSFTGSSQTYTAPYNGYYKLEVWGAGGGESYINGALLTRTSFGGYAVGVTKLNASQSVYVYVGGKGGNAALHTGGTSGWNGGGKGNPDDGDDDAGGGGGGATHIATVSGLLSSLSTYKDTGGTNISKEILIVAGGGGGAAWSQLGGMGGGISGGIAAPDKKATQTSGYSFGQGQNANHTGNSNGSGGGGGGWYGGYMPTKGEHTAVGVGFWVNHPKDTRYSTSYTKYGIYPNGSGYTYQYSYDPGGGGSGYIGSSNLLSGAGITKHMTCYACETSTTDATRTLSNTTIPDTTAISDVSRIGNGYARITWVGDTL